MLLQMRQFTRSWVAYLLIGILAALFVLFLGNGSSLLDTLNIANSNVLASGRGVSVQPQELTRELDLALRQQRNNGERVDRQQAIDNGQHLRVLDALIGRRAVYAYVERLGIGVSDAQIAERIREIPMARNPVTDAFDANAYARFLSEAGYTQAAFEDEIRGELSANMALEAFVAGARAPSSFGALALIYNSESRVVSIAEAESGVLGAIPSPTEAQLQEFYQESQARLRIPEFRALTLVFARTSDFTARVAVPEERLNQEVEARRATAARPERRTYVRIATQTEAQARDAAARLARGEAFDAIATALGAGVQASRSEDQARVDVIDSRVAEAVFTSPARGAPQIVRGQLSPWIVVRIESITPASAPNMTELREAVRLAIANDEAGELLNNAVTAFEDARSGGASAAEAARASGLTALAIPAVTARGQGQDGRPVEALAGKEDLLRAAFATPEGESSDFIPVESDDVIVAVDRIIPESVRPFADVREELGEVWRARERARRLREFGERVVASVQGGQTLAQAARTHRMRIAVSSAELNRQQAQQNLPQGLGGLIFTAREGAAVSEVSPNGQAVLVAVVEAINRPNPAESVQEVEAARVSMQQSMVRSFSEAVQSQIVDEAKVRRFNSRIEQLYRPSSGDGEEQQ